MKIRIKIDYPTFKVRGRPTPNEKLVICDVCGNANWTIHGLSPSVCQCRWNHPNGKQARMREATPAEYEAGKAALTQIIG